MHHRSLGGNQCNLPFTMIGCHATCYTNLLATPPASASLCQSRHNSHLPSRTCPASAAAAPHRIKQSQKKNRGRGIYVCYIDVYISYVVFEFLVLYLYANTWTSILASFCFPLLQLVLPLQCLIRAPGCSKS